MTQLQSHLEISYVDDGNQITELLLKEFGHKIFNGSKERGHELWGADERLLSYKLNKWLRRQYFDPTYTR